MLFLKVPEHAESYKDACLTLEHRHPLRPAAPKRKSQHNLILLRTHFIFLKMKMLTAVAFLEGFWN